MKGISSPGFLLFIYELFCSKCYAPMLYGPEQSQGEAELGAGRKCLFCGPHLLILDMVIWASVGRSCYLQHVFIPSRFSGQYVMPNSSMDPPSAFSPDQNFSEVGFFFFSVAIFSLPLALHWSLEGSKENEPTDKIPFLSCVYCFFMAASVAKSLQSCPTLCDPIDGSPPASPIPGILQARTLEWVVISFSNAWKWKVKVKSLSCVRLLATPWTAAHQAPPSMGFSRQEYWSGVPFT